MKEKGGDQLTALTESRIKEKGGDQLTALTKHQSTTDPFGFARFQSIERNKTIALWVKQCIREFQKI